jgi:signal recognition particle subunit SRP54
MFDNLSDKLQRVFKNMRGEGRLSAENMESALREVRVALLEADVNFKVVKQLIESVKTRAMGQEVLSSLSPSQQVIGIISDELIKILGGHESKLRFANDPPSVFLIVGLQGSGKTTSSGKLRSPSTPALRKKSSPSISPAPRAAKPPTPGAMCSSSIPPAVCTLMTT